MIVTNPATLEPMTALERIPLAKHHGLGNDFLVWLPAHARATDGVDLAVLARRACDRHRGIGADGLIVAEPPAGGPAGDVDAVMVLHNADGSRAEMSGNGIRCLAQAITRARGSTLGALRIATDAGIREVEVRPDPGGDAVTVWASVDMGAVAAGREPAPSTTPAPTAYTRAASLDLGNPHLVLLVEDPGAVDPAIDGPLWEARFPEGCNVHFAAIGAPDVVVMRTWERGAGVTDACGTGATAAAAAVHGWGLTGEQVAVQMPGGEVTVRLGATAVLDGPATWIADAQLPVSQPAGVPA